MTRDAPTKQRYKLVIAYRGTRYHGWQAQSQADPDRAEPSPRGQEIPTIQGTVNHLLESVLRHPVELVGSSRTDSGVHAKGQVAHFDTDQLQIPKEGIRKAVNHQLPSDIFLRSIHPVPATFDAICSTISKRYQYWIWNARERQVFYNDLAWHRWQRLNLEAMRSAAAAFVGEHDFASFARPEHRRETTVRTVLSCDVRAIGPRVIIRVEGNGFLWNMVRIMVGTLVNVGLDLIDAQQIPEILAARNRRAAGPTAPPHGLYLQWIKLRKEPQPDQIGTESPAAERPSTAD